MMIIQFNLLPDVKIEYLKANRQKHIVVLISLVVALLAAVALIILLSIVFVVQKKSISDLSKDIKVASEELRETPELTKILTVQNQLKALPELHAEKPVVTRLFGYLAQATPANATNSRVFSDFAQNIMTLTGTADSLETINKYIDALKGTAYTTAEERETEKQAFSNVVLSSFGRDTQSATYTITFEFDPVIFSGADDVTFALSDVPKNEAGQ
jgi:Tfp pilus assembly protein PilN